MPAQRLVALDMDITDSIDFHIPYSQVFSAWQLQCNAAASAKCKTRCNQLPEPRLPPRAQSH